MLLACGPIIQALPPSARAPPPPPPPCLLFRLLLGRVLRRRADPGPEWSPVSPPLHLRSPSFQIRSRPEVLVDVCLRGALCSPPSAGTWSPTPLWARGRQAERETCSPLFRWAPERGDLLTPSSLTWPFLKSVPRVGTPLIPERTPNQLFPGAPSPPPHLAVGAPRLGEGPARSPALLGTAVTPHPPGGLRARGWRHLRCRSYLEGPGGGNGTFFTPVITARGGAGAGTSQARMRPLALQTAAHRLHLRAAPGPATQGPRVGGGGVGPRGLDADRKRGRREGFRAGGTERGAATASSVGARARSLADTDD